MDKSPKERNPKHLSGAQVLGGFAIAAVGIAVYAYLVGQQSGQSQRPDRATDAKVVEDSRQIATPQAEKPSSDFVIRRQQIDAILPGIEWIRTDHGISGDWKDGWAYVDVTNTSDGAPRDIRIEIKHRNERQVAEAFSAIARIADCANINADRKSRSTRIFDWLSDSFGGYAPVSPRSFGAVRVTIERWRTDVTVVTLHEYTA